ncbi:MAG: hypothetical protein A2293_14100 [Elusimicrobia bacterium RIFOXYB2_FULL_49_7]|nr:MAG: hypothetical protein A2293_14100 [Elusimicrobia bacterium RIFOXYB2_FULL_49_7]
MTKKILVLLVSGLIGLFYACSKKSGTTDPSDTTGPSLTVAAYDDTVFADTMTLSGTVNDQSGVDKVTATVSGIPAIAVPLAGAWTLSLHLTSGVNSFSVIAEDELGNTSSRTVHLYYKTNYLPLDSNSYWKFVRGNDTLSIEVDSAWTLNGFRFSFYRIIFRNQDEGTPNDYKSMILGYDSLRHRFHMGTLLQDITSGTDSLYFYPEYTPTGVFAGKGGVTFSNRQAFLSINGTDSLVVKNCVRLSFSGAANQPVLISDFYLAPYKGFVHIKTNNFSTEFRLADAQYPGLTQ